VLADIFTIVKAKSARPARLPVIGYEETRVWRDWQERTGRALLAAASELATESGRQAAERRARIAEMNAALACIACRILVIAQRRPL
jgi:hypothetical protein